MAAVLISEFHPKSPSSILFGANARRERPDSRPIPRFEGVVKRKAKDGVGPAARPKWMREQRPRPPVPDGRCAW